MCGIIGYTGSSQVTDILLHGLRRLEYRGYDSSGIGVLHRKKIRIAKKAGVLNRLVETLETGMEGSIGIGHTRWATHGGVNDTNAHPHRSWDGRVAVVHNGIIDNHQEIKAQLATKGIAFESETDSEVLAHLIALELDRDVKPKGIRVSEEHRKPAEAVSRALDGVRGTYGLVVMFKDYPDLLVAAKNGSPLAAGLGDDGRFIASDPLAFAAYTTQVVFLEDRELAVLTPDGLSIFHASLGEVNREAETIEHHSSEVSKGEYEDYLEKEIFEQPESIRRALGNGGRLDRDFGTARLGGIDLDGALIRNLRQSVFLGMGTAMNAGLIGARMFEEMSRMQSLAVDASEFRWSNPLVENDSIYFAISQSGETLDTLLAIKEIQHRGGRVYGIVNAVGSSIARLCGAGVYIHAGPEISVASTKAFTAQVASMFLLALSFGRIRHLSPSQGQALLAALERIPDQVNQILAQSSQIRDIARKYRDSRSFLFLGRGISHAVALEGALKLKELSYIHAEGFSAGNLKHGPLALVDEYTPSLFIAPKGDTYEKVLSNIQEVKARNGRTIVVSNGDSRDLEGLADDIIHVPECPEILSPLLTIIPLQLLALYLSRELDRNVDQPRNLAKSVTTE